MPNAHSELEHKFAADHVKYDRFIAWAYKQKPYRYNSRSCPDVYYEQGDNTIRHRWSGGPGELTVKLRKSMDSITDRVEVDLNPSGGTSVVDVTAFLNASGWRRAFTLFKEEVHTFWYEVPGGSVSVSIYGVEKLDEATRRHVGQRRFVEVEVEKDSTMSDGQAALTLAKWRRLLSRVFRLGAPLNVSLYEIYSGRSYKTATQEEQHAQEQGQVSHLQRNRRGVRKRRPGRKGRLRQRRQRGHRQPTARRRSERLRRG